MGGRMKEPGPEKSGHRIIGRSGHLILGPAAFSARKSLTKKNPMTRWSDGPMTRSSSLPFQEPLHFHRGSAARSGGGDGLAVATILNIAAGKDTSNVGEDE